MTKIVGVIIVEIVMVISCPIASPIAVVISIPISAVIPRTMASPTPTIRKTVVIPTPIIIPRTIIVGGPPPVITQIDAYPPIRRRIGVPIHVGKKRIIVTES